MKKLSILALLLAFLFVGKSFAQPQITVHVTGGYNLPMAQLKGDATSSTDLMNTYIMKSGFNGGADVKYYLGKKRNVGLTFSGAYNSFSTGDYTLTGGSANAKMNIISLGLGVEYGFMPKGKTNPFIGVEFTGNFFSGKYTMTPTGGTATEGTLKSASRFGIASNLGLDINLNKNIGFVIGAKYSMANLIGKEYDSTASTTNEVRLDDKEHTVGTTTIAAKNIAWLGVYAGVSFYFNRPKTMVKK